MGAVIAIAIIIAITILAFVLIGTLLDDAVAGIITAIIALIFSGLAFPFWAKLGGGFYPEYSSGVREGYIVKVSQKGFFWRTFEGELQLGSGEMAALHAPFEFSVSDPEVIKVMETSMGNKVRLHYEEWIAQPYWRGESDYEITKITVLPNN